MSSAANERPRARLTIGIRLTLWSAAMTLAACGVLCTVLYAGLRNSLYRELDGFLDGEIHELTSIVMEGVGKYEGIAEMEQEVRRELGSRRLRDLIFRLFDEQGRRLMTSDPEDPLSDTWLDPEIWRRKAGDPDVKTVEAATQQIGYRVMSAWIAVDGGKKFIVQAAYRLDGIERSLNSFLRVSFLALVVAGMSAVIGGGIVARRSLRPVERITATARHIKLSNIPHRIPRSENGDELDRLAQTLNDMLDRIEDQMRRIQQFTADASHELRTPLAAMRGAAEVALSRPRTNEELREVLEENIEHYARLGRIADDLLLLARADAGRLELNRESARLDEMLIGIVDLYAPLAEERGIHLALEACEPVAARIDSQRIRQVMVNLLDNSIKYIGSGKRVSISLTSSPTQLTIRVEDDGPGIPPEHLPHVFDRFYRVDRARSTGAGSDGGSGAGLGLPISHTIIEAHGGHMGVQCRNGTIVTVTLPR